MSLGMTMDNVELALQKGGKLTKPVVAAVKLSVKEGKVATRKSLMKSTTI